METVFLRSLTLVPVFAAGVASDLFARALAWAGALADGALADGALADSALPTDCLALETAVLAEERNSLTSFSMGEYCERTSDMSSAALPNRLKAFFDFMASRSLHFTFYKAPVTLAHYAPKRKGVGREIHFGNCRRIGVMRIDPKEFRVQPGRSVQLHKWPTRVQPVYQSKEEYHEVLQDHIKGLSEQQSLLYASDRYALLVVLQAMDAAGKDSVIRHVMSGVNPQGCQVFSFKHPSAEELDHDFLWSAVRRLPERGRIGIFNRSYYEEVLIVRVHPEILRSEQIPHELMRESQIWEQRFRSIVDLEHHLFHSGTRIVKFFLHVSKEEQRKRLLDRIVQPDKNWKLSAADVTERKFWKQYMKAYASTMEATSREHAPWYIVPADDKPNAQLIVSAVILDTLRELKMSYPKPDAKRLRELRQVRRQLLE
jgi:PPK2 family polyphosphate:nucleotide phosphotransferase